MKKVIIMAPKPPVVGGICKWAENYIRYFHNEDWSINIVDTKDYKLESVYETKKKKRPLNQIKRCIRIWSDLSKQLKDKDSIIVHANIPDATKSFLREIFSLLITKKYYKTFIVEFHCTVRQYGKKTIHYRLLKMLCDHADAIFTLNNVSEKYIMEISNTSVYITPNFVPMSFIRQETKMINDNIINALFVGGLGKYKGTYEIINAAKQLPNIQFNLIGWVSSEITNTKVTENVHFLGEKFGQELLNAYDSADVFVFPSYSEGFSMALLEAMARGVPCIASDVGANRDMLESEGGVVLNNIDVKSIVGGFKSLANPVKRKNCSSWNIEKVRNCYNSDVVTKNFINLYERVLRKK